MKQFLNNLGYLLFGRVYYARFKHSKGASWRCYTMHAWENPIHKINAITEELESNGVEDINLVSFRKV